MLSEGTADTPRSKWARRLVVIGVALVLALATWELIVRILVPPTAPIRFVQVDGLMKERHRIQTQVFRSDPDLFWRFEPNVTLDEENLSLSGVVSNAQGFREDHDLSKTKAENELRILFLGDSATFGVYLDHTEAYPHQVELRLQQVFPDLQVECINAGVPGYTSFQSWRLLETVGFEYQPDLVVFYGGWVDSVSWDDQGDIAHWRSYRSTGLVAPFRWSRLFQVLWAKLEGRGQFGGGEETRPRLYPDEFQGLIRKIDMATAARSIDLILFVGGGLSNVAPNVPARARLPMQIEQLSYNNVRLGQDPHGFVGVVDAVPLLQQMARSMQPGEIFFDGVHPTPETHARFADLLAQQIAGWVDRSWKAD